jgi:hypothetical protein
MELIIIILGAIICGAYYFLKEKKKDKLQDWKPYE